MKIHDVHLKIPPITKFNQLDKGKICKRKLSPKRRIVELGLKDLDHCLHLNKVALNGLWTKPQWATELKSSSRLCFGIFEEKNILALSSGWIITNNIDITAIAVDPCRRREGLGRSILTKLIKESILLNVEKANLEVSEANLAARKFYNSMGFIETGYRKNYFKDGSGAYILSLYIS